MLTPASTMLGNPAGALHLGRPTHTRGTPPTLAALSPTPASARSNSIDSFGSNNSGMCRYYSISRFEVGSGGNGGRSERREGYPQPLLGHPSCQPVPDQPTINLQKSHSVRASSVPSGVLGAARVENAGLLTPKNPL